jgi:tripartite-type tricarboxylate transporter receptor subunit TctC
MIAAALLAALPAQSIAQDVAYPSKPVRIVVAFAPGGIADTVGRLVAQKLSDKFGQASVVENRGGAAGTVAAKYVASTPADGHTLLVHTAAITVNPSLAKEPGADPLPELVPIAMVASTPTVLVVHGSVPANNLQEFVRSPKGARFTYSSAGAGTTPHLTAAYVFKAIGGIDATHVPYQGGAPAITAVLAQQVDMVTTSMPPAVPHIKQGKLKALAVAAQQRTLTLPDVPTLAEIGLPAFEDLAWVAFFAPAKTSAAIVQKLNAEINDATRQPDVRERLTAIGFEPHATSSAEFADYVKKEVAKWARVVNETGFTPN